MSRGAGLPAAVNPEPLVRVSLHCALDDIGHLLRGSLHVALGISTDGKFESRLVEDAEAFRFVVPNTEGRDHRGATVQRDAGNAGGGASRDAEKVHKNALVRKRVLIRQDADGFIAR